MLWKGRKQRDMDTERETVAYAETAARDNIRMRIARWLERDDAKYTWDQVSFGKEFFSGKKSKEGIMKEH